MSNRHRSKYSAYSRLDVIVLRTAVSDEKIKFAKDKVKEKYEFSDDQISTSTLNCGFEDRMIVRVDIRGGDEIVAALEYFLQLMTGNIIIFSKEIQYAKNFQS